MFDNIDREAMREGFAISRLQSYVAKKRRKYILRANEREKNKKIEEVNILRILNIVQGKRHGTITGETTTR